jgi:hypothetical protein
MRTTFVTLFDSSELVSTRSRPMPTQLRYARTSLLIITAIGCLSLIIVVLPRSQAAVAAVAPSATDVATGLHRLELGPDALTAAGLSSSDATELVQRAFSHLIESQNALDLADLVHADAKRNSTILERTVRSGTADDDELAALPAALAALASATSQQQTLLAGLVDGATADLTGPQRAKLDRIRLNQDWKLPIEFLVIDREETVWVALRDALANERISARLGEMRDAAAQTLLAQLRADPAVSMARANLDANLGVIEAAWDAAVGF